MRRRLPQRLQPATVRYLSVTGGQNGLMLAECNNGCFTTIPSLQLRRRHQYVSIRNNKGHAQPPGLERARLQPWFSTAGAGFGGYPLL